MSLEQKVSYEEALQILLEYIATLEEGPQQRSTEWYAIRFTNIGGSEVAAVLGIDPYKTYAKLIADKVGIGEPFKGSTATRWGTIFEPVTKKWSEIVLKMDDKIIEAPSIKGKFKRQRYSPDGLGVVKLDDAIYIILFEFKAPLSRQPGKTIPRHYKAQVKTGLLTIDIVDRCIFVDNCYRKCTLNDFSFNNTYDEGFHSCDFKKQNSLYHNKTPYACGIIFFYHTYKDHDKFCKYANELSEIEDIDDKTIEDVDYNEKHSLQGDIDLLIHSKNKLIDFGGVSNNTFDRLLDLFDQKRIKVKYSSIIYDTNRINEIPIVKTHDNLKHAAKTFNPEKTARDKIDQFIADCNIRKVYPIGYLPWKLMNTSFIFQERDLKWASVIQKPLEDAIDTLDNILKAPNPEEEYYNFFPAQSEEDKKNNRYFTEDD